MSKIILPAATDKAAILSPAQFDALAVSLPRQRLSEDITDNIE